MPGVAAGLVPLGGWIEDCFGSPVVARPGLLQGLYRADFVLSCRQTAWRLLS